MAIPYTKHLTLTLDDEEVHCALTTALLSDAPEGGQVLTTFCSSEDVPGTPKYSLAISGYQSWSSAQDVFQIIHDAYKVDPHAEIDCVLEVGGKTRSFTAVPLADAPFGGDAGSAMTADVTLSVTSEITDGTAATTP